MQDRTQTPASFLQRHLAEGRTPAVQYRFFSHDSIHVAYDGGHADVAGRIPVSRATRYNGFSVTKTFTALAVLQLVEDGALALDRPAADDLPDFPYPHDITVRHLMTHSAGLPNPVPLSWIHPQEEHAAFERDAFFTEQFARSRKVKARPNERFAYSNLGYVLLGQMIEHVSGVSYEQYVTDRILTPLGVAPGELGFELDPHRQAKGYHKRSSFSYWMLGFFLDRSRYIDRNEEGWMAFRPYYVNGAAYGGLIGTADGFARYGQALLASPSPLLRGASKQMLFTENVLTSGKTSGMALSWFAGALDGHVYYAHAGGGGGYYAEVRLYPELGRGSVILFNRSGMTDERFLDEVDRLAMRLESPAP